MTERVGEEKRGLVVAIDGPSGVGKSTISRSLAERIGCRYVDTGAMYRAVALLARQGAVPFDDPKGLAGLAREMEIEFVEARDGPRVRLNGEDVTHSLRLPGVPRKGGCSMVANYFASDRRYGSSASRRIRRARCSSFSSPATSLVSKSEA